MQAEKEIIEQARLEVERKAFLSEADDAIRDLDLWRKQREARTQLVEEEPDSEDPDQPEEESKGNDESDAEPEINYVPMAGKITLKEEENEKLDYQEALRI